MKKRFLSILLALCMVTQLVPTAAFAAPDDAVGNGLNALEETVESAQSTDQGAGDGENSTTDNEGQAPNDEAIEDSTGGDGDNETALHNEETANAVAETGDAYDAELADNAPATTISTDMEIASGATVSASAQCTISGNVTISGGGTFKRASADGYITVPSGATLTLNGVTLDGKSIESTYPMIKVESGGKLIIKGNTVIKNCATSGSGGAIDNSGTLTMEGGEITDCTANYAGGVYNGGTFTMSGGSVAGNTAKAHGGGVWNSGKLSISGGSVTNNSAGIYGGGVCNYRTLIMTGGSIKGNHAGSTGGGVDNNGTFSMSGGSIVNNEAEGKGGGVSNYDRSTFTMTGGSIEDNVAGSYGGGVYNYADGTINLSGSVSIVSNTVKEARNNLYIQFNEVTDYESGTYSTSEHIGKVVVVGGMDANASVGITAQKPNSGATVVTGSTDTRVFFSDDEAYALTENDDKSGLKLVTKPHAHCVYGDANCAGTADGHSAITWTAWDGASDITYDDSNTAYVYLTASVERSTELTVASGHTLYLCLNGQSIAGPDGKDVIKVASGASLAITDCGTTGKITHNSGATGRGIFNNGTLILWNGGITGNTTNDAGGGVFNSGNGTFNMYGGSITNCTAKSSNPGGGGVYNSAGGAFNMYGGSISGCKAARGGGVFNNENGTFKMTGGSIANCTASTYRQDSLDGGGVCSDGTFSMTGGSITDCTAGERGGGVYNWGPFTMSGGAIAGNTAPYGGGVYHSSSFNKNITFTMSGGEISGNTASTNGGGVYNENTFKMTDGKISGNTASANGGGVYNDGTFNASGNPVISGNVKGGTINDNHNLSGGTANNVYLYNGKTITVDTATGMGESARVGITGTLGQIVVTGTTDTTGFYCDDENYELVQDGDASLKLAKMEIQEHSHCICGGTTDIGDHTEHTSVTWTRWTSTDSLPTDAGYYYLANNVQLSSAWTVGSGVDIKLCLNGKTVTGANGQSVINNKGTLTITDCTTDTAKVGKITHKDEETGNGIACSGALYLYNGSITGNTVNWDGGGLNLGNGSFNMYGGEFSNNKAIGGKRGGAVYVGCTITFNMYGGSITGNTAENGYGGGVMVDGNDTAGWRGNLNMCGGVVSGNSAEYGGGVYNKSTFSMSGGSITGNSAYGTNGGGVYNYGSEHTACNMSGNVTVAGNTGGNVYSNVTLNVVDPGMDANARAGISYGTVGNCQDTTVFTADDENYELVSDGDTGLKLVKAHKHKVCGEAGCEEGHGDELTWKAWTSTNSLPSEPGNYYLMDNVSLADTWNCSADVKLCLNGKKITGVDGKSVIDVNDNLTITDCQTNAGEITHMTDDTNGVGRGIGNYGTLTLWNGSITGNSADNGGVYSSGTFTMNGGSITNNSADNGGGVYCSNGTFTMAGGSISSNTANNGASVYVGYEGTFAITGGSVVSNEAKGQGGGVSNWGTFTMSGGSIVDNKAATLGGGVCNYGVVNLSGNVTITGNAVNGAANNVYLASGGKKITVAEGVTLTGASVGIIHANPDNGDTVVSGSTDTEAFSSDDANYELVGDGNGGLKLSAKTVTISGVKLLVSDGGDEMTADQAGARSKAYDGLAVAYDASKVAVEPDTVTGWEPLSYTWQEATVTDGVATYTDLDAAPSDAGSYRLLVTAKRGDVILGSTELPFTIAAKSLTVNATAEDKAYDGSTAATLKSATLDGVLDADKSAVSLGNDKVTVAFEDKSAGDSKAVTATVADGALSGDRAGNYTIATAAAANAKISPKTLTVNVTAQSKTYDGTTSAQYNTLGTYGVLEDDAGDLTTQVTSASFADKNVGTNKTVTLKLELTGDAASNYTIDDEVTGTASITAKELTVTGATVEERTYDGTTGATVTAVTFGGLVEGESLAFGTDYAVSGAAFDSADVAAASKVNFSVALANTAVASNYALRSTTGEQAATIKKAAAGDCAFSASGKRGRENTCDVPEGYVVAGGEATVSEVTDEHGILDGAPTYAGGKLTYKLKASATEDQQATVKLAVASGNYKDYIVAATLGATAKEQLKIDVAAGEYTYNGSAQAPTDVTVEGDKVDAADLVTTYEGVGGTDYGPSTDAPKAVGKYVMTVAVADTDPEYYGYTTCAFQIAKKELTIKDLAVADKYYDGTTKATIAGTPALDGAVDGDDVALVNGVPTFSSVSVGENILVDFTDFSLTGKAASNYELTQPNGVTANILAYDATGSEYTATTSDWTNQDFVVTAGSGWLVSEANTAEGTWSESLTRSAETGSAGDRLTFYVKNAKYGYISEAITKTYRIDKTAPAITGAQNGKTYCGPVELTVADANLDKVTVNGEAVEPAADEVMALAAEAPAGFTFTVQPAEGEQTVVATDMAGNSTTLKLTVNDGHTWGAWSSNGDGTHTHACEYDAATEKAECHGGTATCSDRAVCDDCGQAYGEVDASNHATLTHVEAKAESATAEGNIEYWHCEACGRYFADEAGEKEIQQADTVVAKKAEAPNGNKGDSTDGKTGGNTGDSANGAGSGKSQIPRTGDSSVAAWPLAILGAVALAAALVSARRRRS